LIATKLHTQYVAPLRTDLETALNAKVAHTHTAAEAGLLKTLPLSGKEASTIAAPFLRKLQMLFDLLGPIATADRTFQAAWDAFPFVSKATLGGVVDELGNLLKDRMLDEIAAQWPALAARVIAGDVV